MTIQTKEANRFSTLPWEMAVEITKHTSNRDFLSLAATERRNRQICSSPEAARPQLHKRMMPSALDQDRSVLFKQLTQHIAASNQLLSGKIASKSLPRVRHPLWCANYFLGVHPLRPDTLTVTDTRRGGIVSELRTPTPIWCTAMSADGRYCAAGTSDGAWVLDLHETPFQARRVDHPSIVYTLAFSLDGSRLVTGSGGGHGHLRVFDTATRTLLNDNNLQDTRIVSLDLLPDGQRAIVGLGTGKVMLVDIASGEALHVLSQPTRRDPCEAVAASACGRYVAALPDVRIWDTHTGEVIFAAPHLAGVQAIAFSSDGSKLAIASHQKLWLMELEQDVAWTCQEVPNVQPRGIVMFLADSTSLIVGSENDLCLVRVSPASR